MAKFRNHEANRYFYRPYLAAHDTLRSAGPRPELPADWLVGATNVEWFAQCGRWIPQDVVAEYRPGDVGFYIFTYSDGKDMYWPEPFDMSDEYCAQVEARVAREFASI